MAVIESVSRLFGRMLTWTKRIYPEEDCSWLLLCCLLILPTLVAVMAAVEEEVVAEVAARSDWPSWALASLAGSFTRSGRRYHCGRIARKGHVRATLYHRNRSGPHFGAAQSAAKICEKSYIAEDGELSTPRLCMMFTVAKELNAMALVCFLTKPPDLLPPLEKASCRSSKAFAVLLGDLNVSICLG